MRRGVQSHRSGIAPIYKVRCLEENSLWMFDVGPSRLMYNLATKLLPSESSDGPVTTAWEESSSRSLDAYTSNFRRHLETSTLSYSEAGGRHD